MIATKSDGQMILVETISVNHGVKCLDICFFWIVNMEYKPLKLVYIFLLQMELGGGETEGKRPVRERKKNANHPKAVTRAKRKGKKLKRLELRPVHRLRAWYIRVELSGSTFPRDTGLSPQMMGAEMYSSIRYSRITFILSTRLFVIDSIRLTGAKFPFKPHNSGVSRT